MTKRHCYQPSSWAQKQTFSSRSMTILLRYENKEEGVPACIRDELRDHPIMGQAENQRRICFERYVRAPSLWIAGISGHGRDVKCMRSKDAKLIDRDADDPDSTLRLIQMTMTSIMDPAIS